MSLRHSRKQRLQQTQRMRWLSNLFTVSISVVIVTVVLLLPQANAYAQLMDVFADQQSIYYHVYSVQIQSDTSVPSVRLIIESQYETLEEELPDGYIQGRISNLRPNTLYQVKLVGNKGFGDYLMDQVTVRTVSTGQVRLFVQANPLSNSEEVIVRGGVMGSLPAEGSVTLWMASGYGTQEPNRTNYVHVTLTDGAFEIPPMYPYGQTLHFLLEWTSPTSETLILDKTTLSLSHGSMNSLYLSGLGPNQLSVYAYPPSHLGSQVTLELRLFEKNRLIRTLQVVMPSSEDSHSHEPIRFLGLKQNTLYTLELWANYYDSIIKRNIEKRIDRLEVITPPRFVIQVTEVFTDGAKWQVLLHDSSQVLTQSQIMIHFLETDQHYYASLSFVQQPDGTYLATIQVPNPSTGAYELFIYSTLNITPQVSYSMVEVTRKKGMYE